MPIPLGEFAVVSRNANPAKGTVSTETYQATVIWGKVGLVEVLEDQEYENFRRGKGWSVTQWMQLTQEDVQKKIVVTVTERGRQYLTASPTERLWIPKGKLTVTKIVKNEERRKGVDDYRLIMLTYDAAWSPEYMEYLLALGRKTWGSRAMILLKYDPFESKWKWITEDWANDNGEFSSNNVAREVAQ